MFMTSIYKYFKRNWIKGMHTKNISNRRISGAFITYLPSTHDEIDIHGRMYIYIYMWRRSLLFFSFLILHRITTLTLIKDLVPKEKKGGEGMK